MYTSYKINLTKFTLKLYSSKKMTLKKFLPLNVKCMNILPFKKSKKIINIISLVKVYLIYFDTYSSIFLNYKKIVLIFN